MFKLTLIVAKRNSLVDGMPLLMWVATATLTIMEGPKLGEYTATYSDLTGPKARKLAMSWVEGMVG